MNSKVKFLAGTDTERMVIIDPEVFGSLGNLFALRADGNGMRNAGIYSGDLLIFDADRSPQNGDIVIIDSEGQQFCRRIFFEGNSLRIRREDGVTPDIIVGDYVISAVLIGSIRRYVS